MADDPAPDPDPIADPPPNPNPEPGPDPDPIPDPPPAPEPAPGPVGPGGRGDPDFWVATDEGACLAWLAPEQPGGRRLAVVWEKGAVDEVPKSTVFRGPEAEGDPWTHVWDTLCEDEEWIRRKWKREERQGRGLSICTLYTQCQSQCMDDGRL